MQTPTIVVFAQNWSGVDPTFAALRGLALSEFLCLLANQNVTFVSLFCTKLPFCAPCYLKTAFLLANHNQEIYVTVTMIYIDYIYILCRGFIKVLNRRATEFDTRAKNWQGPEGLVP